MSDRIPFGSHESHDSHALSSAANAPPLRQLDTSFVSTLKIIYSILSQRLYSAGVFRFVSKFMRIAVVSS